ncbi:hypothetical protein H4R19_005800, partial [Coemansia spiralis]
MFVLTPLSPRIFEDPIVECRASEELAHEIGASYTPSKGFARRPGPSGGTAAARACAPTDSPVSAFPRPHTRTQPRPAADSRAAAEASLCRNSLFPNAVKQQSRCLSVLLQHGPHGGIRRIGPLLITKERGGRAIALLNPAFIDMMDVQPVDSHTTAFLKRSNIRRRSFSMPPTDPGADWLGAISAAATGGSKQAALSGPGMWWPLNDDNCSDEVAYDVHVAALEGSEAAHPVLERMGSASTLASTGMRPATAPRKGSVSSQLRLMVRAESSHSVSTSSADASSAQGGYHFRRPSLTHMASDTSDATTAQPVAGAQMLTPSHQLADVTMKTESGSITRSLKSISLRMLVNRLASPEGNVDSDLLTDFLNSYRFFAHPIDVMRLVVVRYLNCFAARADADSSDGSDADDNDDDDGDSRFLTINGWHSSTPQDDAAGDRTADEAHPPLPASSQSLPPLARNDSAIVQLRVMNIIKYWIKFHPHDFRLHHRLTRLLLLFLSHIQKQPGRADFVHSIRQKLMSGKLLAV